MGLVDEKDYIMRLIKEMVRVLDLKFFRLTRELVSMSEIGAYGFTRAFFGIGEDSTDSEFCEGKVIE